ncbi:MAG: ATP-binding protein [Deltaproteobacteria bacterium]|nr:ATP-binding protein [Deltaproteobacteria bacterium]
MPGQPADIRLPARLESLHPLMGFVSDYAAGLGIPQARIREIELVMEEILVNIFSYAYPDGPGDVWIVCRDEAGKMQIEIADEGVPFNILTRDDPDIEAGVEERGIGGLGIFFVKQLVQDVRYRRQEGRNILTLSVDPTPVSP